MFEQPTKSDIDRALSTLVHEAQRELAVRRNEILSEATKVGALGSSRLIVTMLQEADAIHKKVLERGIVTLQNFMQRMDIDTSVITEWARPHLKDIGNELIGTIPLSGFPDECRGLVIQYEAQFDERLVGALRDTAIGLVKGVGFAGLPKQDEWISAAEAIETLKPVLAAYFAPIRICERAHAGLVRARAEQFHQGHHVLHSHDIPKEFWWAEGHEALEQDWVTGDFSTWVQRGSIQLKAFGVSFARSDIEKLVPLTTNKKTKGVFRSEEDDQLIKSLDALVPSAALSYEQAMLDLADTSRVSFRGPALELREALREILDHLATDSEVATAPGYTQEAGRTKPTMKQKVRFIMKKKGKNSTSEAPERAVTAFEESIAELTRAIYERSSRVTHSASERQAVVQLRRYVVATLHELLAP